VKRVYSAPRLVEYGRLSDLTLGSGTLKPDLLNGAPTSPPSACDVTSPSVTSCNIAVSSP
jgi:hypothetical protein